MPRCLLKNSSNQLKKTSLSSADRLVQSISGSDCTNVERTARSGRVERTIGGGPEDGNPRAGGRGAGAGGGVGVCAGERGGSEGVRVGGGGKVGRFGVGGGGGKLIAGRVFALTLGGGGGGAGCLLYGSQFVLANGTLHGEI